MIAGISVTEARRLTPGFIMDMFKQRAEYDARLAGHKIARRAGLI